LTLTGTNTYTGGTTVAGGTLSLGSNSAAGTGSITTTGSVVDYANGITVANAIVINSNTTQLQTLAGVSATQSGVISETGGARPLEKIGTGKLILTAANTYTGGTTISAGTLQIGAGGATGAIAGNVTDNATLAFNRSDSVTFAGIVSGTGSLTKSGTGTLTLSGTNTYTGGTTISAGTLAVTGKIGAVTVTSGTLQGTGTVGTTTVASGSTLSPGINGALGTLSVSGNLTMASGSNYAVAVTPTAASKVIVSGSANVNGAVTATFAAGNYTVGQKFAIVESTGLVTGSFASLTHAGAALPFYLTDNLSYTSNSVYLNFATKNLTPLLPTGSASNLTNTATGIDAAVTTGGIPSTGMIALYGQTGATLGTSLTQAQGQVGTNLATSVTQSFAPFLKTMMAQGAPDQGATSRVWGTVYGGHTGISANVTTGAASLSGSNVGLAVGGQMIVAEIDAVLGASLAFGQQIFSSGNGTGISQDLMLGAYGTKTVMDRGYISASLGYGILNVTTTRTLTVSGTDILSGKVNAQEFGGRVEGGYRFSVDDQFGLTPYLAGSLQNIVTPAYVETVQSGTSSFALSYLSQKNTFGHTEAGTHLDRSFQLDDGSTLSAQGTIGWSHQLGYSPVSTVSFQSLSGSSFLLNGIKPANDTAVLGLKLQAQKATGLSYGVRLDSQLGAGTTILQATGNVAYRW
jgi:autotransporter-associated beta strand protein